MKNAIKITFTTFFNLKFEIYDRLSARARNLLNELGSAYIQDLDYRDVWIFVGQKGINGFSSYEYVDKFCHIRNLNNCIYFMIFMLF